MGVFKRRLEKAIIPLLFAPVLFRHVRPNSKASLEVRANKKIPEVNKPITLDYYVIHNGGAPLFSIKYTPSYLSLPKDSVDFQYANAIEVSGPDVTDEIVDLAVMEYQEYYQTPIEKPKAR